MSLGHLLKDGQKTMSDEMTTKPTIETVLERIENLESRVNARFDSFEIRVNDRFDSFELRVNDRFDRMDERMDKLEKEIHSVASLAHSTQVEVVSLRRDIKELRSKNNKSTS